MGMQLLIGVSGPQPAFAGVLAPEPSSEKIPAVTLEVSHHRGAIPKVEVA